MRKFLVGTLVVATLLSACGKKEEVAQVHPVAQNTAMSQQVMAIKSCMEEGLSEDTCAGVHKQMVAGTLTGSPNVASCEAQYGAGQCGSVPVARPDGSSGSVILPLAAGAALGYLAHSMMSTNSMPGGAVMPQRSWVNNRPAIYQQAAKQNAGTTQFLPSVSGAKPVAQTNNFAVKDGYGDKKVSVNGKPVVGNNVVSQVAALPSQKQTEQVKPSVQTKVEYKAPTSAYAQQQAPAKVSPPTVTYKPITSYSPAPSSGSRKR
jgi:uncharacterized protein YgiB involved in biofilm formation